MDAAKELESALLKVPLSKEIRRKLIICHLQCSNINRALELFVPLIEEDIDFIVNSDPIYDDCPCPELVYDLEKQSTSYHDLLYYDLKLGILWLYCDINKSIHYFRKSATKNPVAKKILSLLNAYQLKCESD